MASDIEDLSFHDPDVRNEADEEAAESPEAPGVRDDSQETDVEAINCGGDFENAQITPRDDADVVACESDEGWYVRSTVHE